MSKPKILVFAPREEPPETIAALGRSESRKSRWRTIALWVIAAIFMGILIAIRQL